MGRLELDAQSTCSAKNGIGRTIFWRISDIQPEIFKQHLTEAGPADLGEAGRGGHVWKWCGRGWRGRRSKMFNLAKLFGGLRRKEHLEEVLQGWELGNA